MTIKLTNVIILISANTEWQIVKTEFPHCQLLPSPFGEWFKIELIKGQTVVFFQSGWGKIPAAASTQYVIDQWKPELIINIGTCGGFKGCIKTGEIVLVNKTIVYDILEQMGDQAEATDFFSTVLDLSWLKQPYPMAVIVNKMLSADRDIIPADIPKLKEQYQGIAADWESAAIAYVAHQNHTKCLILRGVTDIVDETGGEAYGNDLNLFKERAGMVMKKLIRCLPDWIGIIKTMAT
jgi:adenosylhomocysteine nucleosidase